MLLALGGGWDGAFYSFSSFYFAPFQPALRRCGAEVGVGYPRDGSREYPTPTFYAEGKAVKRSNAFPALISIHYTPQRDGWHRPRLSLVARNGCYVSS